MLAHVPPPPFHHAEVWLSWNASKILARHSAIKQHLLCWCVGDEVGVTPNVEAPSVNKDSQRGIPHFLESGTPHKLCHVVKDYHLLDFSERLNTSSYVNVVFEPDSWTHMSRLVAGGQFSGFRVLELRSWVAI